VVARKKAKPKMQRANLFHAPLTLSRTALLDSQGGDAHFRETLYLMVLAFSRLFDCRNAFGRAAKLTGSQFAVLMGVAYTQSESGVTIAGLAAHVQLASTHVTTEVGRLVTRGLLEKCENPEDRRSVLVRLTRKGELAVEGLAPFMRSINDILFDGISLKQFKELELFLRHFARQSQRALDEIKRQENAAHK
jgi:MarR family transcriptional regulator, organic hydroperoxide resistance regulator